MKQFSLIFKKFQDIFCETSKITSNIIIRCNSVDIQSFLNNYLLEWKKRNL
jgi:hypothetical protein